MSEITNPPLGPGAAPTSGAGHANGSIVNPPLDGGRSSASASDLQNPPLIGGDGSSAAGRSAGLGAGADNPLLASLAVSLDDAGMNPPLDEADIERWFEAQLEQAAAVPVPTTKSLNTRPASKKSVTRKRTAKKSTTKKRATKRTAKKRSAANAPAKKKAARASAATKARTK